MILLALIVDDADSVSGNRERQGVPQAAMDDVAQGMCSRNVTAAAADGDGDLGM